MIILLCLKIFFARLIDVSLGTVRTIFTIKGRDFIASIIGFIEITVWFLVVKEALNTINNGFFIAFSYAMGFSVGTFIGGKISKKFIKSNLEVQVILSNKSDKIINELHSAGFGVTKLEVSGKNSSSYMLYINIKNNNLDKLKRLINKLDKNAFLVVNETQYVKNGYFNIVK